MSYKQLIPIEFDDLLCNDVDFIHVANMIDKAFRIYGYEIRKKLTYIVFHWVDENNNYRCNFNSEDRKKTLKVLNKRDNDLCELSLIDDLKNKPNKAELRKKIQALTNKSNAEYFLTNYILEATSIEY